MGIAKKDSLGGAGMVWLKCLREIAKRCGWILGLAYALLGGYDLYRGEWLSTADAEKLPRVGELVVSNHFSWLLYILVGLFVLLFGAWRLAVDLMRENAALKQRLNKLDMIRSYIAERTKKGQEILAKGKAIEAKRGQTNSRRDAYNEMQSLDRQRDAVLELYRRWRQENVTVFNRAIANKGMRLKQLVVQEGQEGVLQMLKELHNPWKNLESDLKRLTVLHSDLRSPHLDGGYDFDLLAYSDL